MNKRPSIDRSLLLPIGIGVFSLVGLLLILLTAYPEKPPAAASPAPTVTPFKYFLIATETPIPGPAALGTAPPAELVVLTADTSGEGASTSATEAFSQADPSANTFLEGSTAGLESTDRYDNSDPRLEYSGDWVSLSNVGNAYQNTLAVSNMVGDGLIFTFTGRQIIIGYLPVADFGLLSITIDDDEFQLDQAVGKEWTSPQFDQAEHVVFILHESGNSVNLDYINILSLD